MKRYALFLLLLMWISTFSLSAQTLERKGFLFGAAAGAGYLALRPGTLPAQSGVGLSLPNFRFGWMFGQRTAVCLLLPGTVYGYRGATRPRDRGFEGIIPTVQYWPANRWWVSAGVGLGMDAPAFYDIKDSSERKFYFGTAGVAATGYELWQRGRCAFDVQVRLHAGQMSIAEGPQKGLAVNILAGFTWY